MVFPLFPSRCFLKEMENMFSVFLSSYRNTVKVWENSKKLWKHSPTARIPRAFLVLPNIHSCFYNTVHVFYFLKVCHGFKGSLFKIKIEFKSDGFWIKNKEKPEKIPQRSKRTWPSRQNFLGLSHIPSQNKWTATKLKLSKNSIFSKSGCSKTSFTPICMTLSWNWTDRNEWPVEEDTVLTYSRRIKWKSYNLEKFLWFEYSLGEVKIKYRRTWQMLTICKTVAGSKEKERP